jgi:hypothetical protein
VASHRGAPTEGGLKEFELQLVEVLLESRIRLILLLIQFALDCLIDTLFEHVLTLLLCDIQVILAGHPCPYLDLFFKLFENFMVFGTAIRN